MATSVEKVAQDQGRLDALRAFDILDTPAEQLFEDAVAIASALCEAPIALVSLVDEDRQWFKAKYGIDFDSTPLDQSVCAHAIRQDGLLIIPDLTLDERTRDNALVNGEAAAIRFYAGAPLITSDGVALGSLCVIDEVPRPRGLTDEQQRGLAALGRQVTALIEMRSALRESGDWVAAEHDRAGSLESQHANARSAEEAGRIGTFALDVATDELTVSPRFCQIFGLPVMDRYAAGVMEALVIADDRDKPSNHDKRMRGEVNPQTVYRIQRPDGGIRWIERRAAFQPDEAGHNTRLFGTVEDVSERMAEQARQSILNSEIHHRMKNTLAMVQALAQQTLRGVSERAAVATLEQRLFALGKAHDVLLRNDWEAASMRGIVAEAIGALGQEQRVTVTGDDLQIGPQAAISLSMLIHELGTNAIKYGALSVEGGRVAIAWHVANPAGGATELRLSWSEEGGPAAQPPVAKGFGSRLINLGLVGTGGADVRYLATGLIAEFSASLEMAQRH